MAEDNAFTLDLGSGHAARAVLIADDLRHGLEQIGLPGPARVLVVVGGAGGMDDDTVSSLQETLAQAVLPVLAEGHVVVIDGGTDAGVMRMIGRWRASGADFPLLGVAADGTVTWPSRSAPTADAAPLEPNHTHFVLVPGDNWGDESPWLARAATELAGELPSVTMLVNGGQISFDDVERSLEEGRPVMVLDGTGRTADRIAAAAAGDHSDARATQIATSPQTFVDSMADHGAVRARLSVLLHVPS
jgi:hypothetical protein